MFYKVNPKDIFWKFEIMLQYVSRGGWDRKNWSKIGVRDFFRVEEYSIYVSESPGGIEEVTWARQSQTGERVRQIHEWNKQTKKKSKWKFWKKEGNEIKRSKDWNKRILFRTKKEKEQKS